VTSAAELREAAATYLGTPVEAAGIFAADVSIVARAAGGAAASAAADAVGLGDAPLAEGLAAAAGMRMAQEAGAAAQGLTGVMLVAVTTDDIVLMDWHGTSASGTGPTEVLVSFNRAVTQISAHNVGATKKVTLTDSTRQAKISGSVGLLSSGKEGKRDVLRALHAE
jgi:hypothetical protein